MPRIFLCATGSCDRRPQGRSGDGKRWSLHARRPGWCVAARAHGSGDHALRGARSDGRGCTRGTSGGAGGGAPPGQAAPHLWARAGRRHAGPTSQPDGAGGGGAADRLDVAAPCALRDCNSLPRLRRAAVGRALWSRVPRLLPPSLWVRRRGRTPCRTSTLAAGQRSGAVAAAATPLARRTSPHGARG